jgi:hypothetical protein
MPSDFRRQERPMSQLRRPLTSSEQDGTLAREAGLLPRRVQQPGRRYFAERANDPVSIYHVHPLPSRHHPLPRR